MVENEEIKETMVEKEEIKVCLEPIGREQGPPVPISSITAPVFKTNPILDELLNSLTLISNNDASLTSLDIKDCTCLSGELVKVLADGLKSNTYLKKLVMPNVMLSTSSAIELAMALRENQALEVLNLESNQIEPKGMREIALSLAHNQALKELRLGHQKSITSTGMDAEQAFADALGKNNQYICLI